MKKYTLILAVLFSLFMTGCQQNLSNNSGTGKVTVNVAAGQRTIVPVDFDISTVENWNITFHCTSDEKTADVTKSFSNTSSFTLLPGKYSITVESVSSGDYTLYGKTTDDVVITKGSNTSVTILVSLKKAAYGSGFSYTVTLTDSDFIKDYGIYSSSGEYTYPEEPEYTFSAYLLPINSTSEDDKKDLTVEVGVDEDKYISVNIADAEGSSTTRKYYAPALKISKNEQIASGYYYLTVDYIYNGVTGVIPITDSLVEIADNLTTSGSCEVSFKGAVTKTFYVDNSSEFDGKTPFYKKEFNSAIKWLYDNQSEWVNANIYFAADYTTLDDDIETMEQDVKRFYPYYDVSVNPTSSDENEAGYNKVVNVYTDGSLQYVLKNGTIVITEDCSKYAGICLVSETEYTDVTIECDEAPEDLSLELCQIGVNVTLNNVSEEFYISCDIPSDNVSEYNTSTPFLIIVPTDKENNPISAENISIYRLFSDGTEDSRDGDDLPYTVLTSTDEDGNMKCYTAESGQPGLTISKAVPDYSILSSSKYGDIVLFNNSTYTFSINSDSGISDCSYKWLLNGNDSGTTASTYSLNPLTDKNVVMGKNTLLAVLNKGNEYLSRTYDFTMKPEADTGVMLFNSDGYYGVVADTAAAIEAATSDSLTNGNLSAVDFTFDGYGNLYTATAADTDTASYDGTTTGGYNITRYDANTDGTVSSSGTLIYTTMSQSALIYCDSIQNVLYIMDCPNDTSTDSKQTDIIKIAEPQSFSAKILNTDMTNSASVSNSVIRYTSSLTLPCQFVVSNNMVYTYEYSDYVYNGNLNRYLLCVDDGKYTVKYPEHLKGIDNLCSNVTLGVNEVNENIKYSLSKYGTDLDIKDMIVADGYLYLLFREDSGNTVETGYNYHRGGIVKVELKDTYDTASTSDDYLSVYSFETNLQMLGWCMDGDGLTISTTYQGEDWNLNFTHGDFIKNGSINYFAGPEKFVAVKPGKLVILDYGWGVSDYTTVTNEDDNSTTFTTPATISRIDRIVTLDLDSLKMTATPLSYSLTSNSFTYDLDAIYKGTDVGNLGFTVK